MFVSAIFLKVTCLLAVWKDFSVVRPFWKCVNLKGDVRLRMGKKMKNLLSGKYLKQLMALILKTDHTNILITRSLSNDTLQKTKMAMEFHRFE